MWAPITSTQAPMWETGYKGINAGGDITEGGKTFKASGICRLRKTTDPTKFHIGRAVVDQNNALHCYMKAKGVETDIAGQRLQSVEVLLRPSLAQAAAPSAVGQQGVTGAAAQAPVAGQAPAAAGLATGVNPVVKFAGAAPTAQAPAQAMFG